MAMLGAFRCIRGPTALTRASLKAPMVQVPVRHASAAAQVCTFLCVAIGRWCLTLGRGSCQLASLDLAIWVSTNLECYATCT